MSLRAERDSASVRSATVPAETVPADTVPAERRSRRVTGWLTIGILLVAVGTIGALLSTAGQWTQKEALAPDSAAPDGTRALVSILEDQGIDVVVTDSRAQALAALADGSATLVLPDAPSLSDDALTTLASGARDVVLIDPRSRSLRLVSDDARAIGVADDALVEPGCTVTEAVRSGSIRPRTVFSSGEAQGCYGAAGGYALLIAEHVEGPRVAAVDGVALFTNENLATDGNAALAMNLMGRNATLVWYVPSITDSDLEPTNQTLGDLTPPWVSPVIALMIVAAIAAALWRGIRFGPLVAERLPVTVRGEETSVGRAHLYERADDLSHVAELLRHGTRARLARLLGLAGSIGAGELHSAVAVALNSAVEPIRETLSGSAPTNRRELTQLSERLAHLEADVRAALRPERNDP